MPPASIDPRVVAAALALAFRDDPSMAWGFPDETQRGPILEALFRAATRYAVRFGTVDVATDDRGAALWLAPGEFRMTPWRMLRFGHGWLRLRMTAAEWRRLRLLNAYAMMLRTRAAAAPHWYLQAVGIEPDAQRRGLGSDLVRAGLERSDRDHLPCYLETTNEANLPLYERLGFRVEIRGRVPPDGPSIWAMLRPRRR